MKILLLLFVTAFSNLYAQDPANASRHDNLESGVAIDGYDPVSYFDGKPKKGSPDHTATHNGVRYYFANAATLSRFQKEAEKFVPAYGGWCAYAMGRSGEKVKIDPETFKILNGKLYLFYNFWGNNTLEDWNENERDLRIKADANWKKILQAAR